MTDAMARERETKKEISPIHGQAIYQSYYSRIKEACQAYKPLVPSLTSSVKGLHSMLTRLARAASLHAGNLHKVMWFITSFSFLYPFRSCSYGDCVGQKYYIIMEEYNLYSSNRLWKD